MGMAAIQVKSAECGEGRRILAGLQRYLDQLKKTPGDRQAIDRVENAIGELFNARVQALKDGRLEIDKELADAYLALATNNGYAGLFDRPDIQRVVARNLAKIEGARRGIYDRPSPRRFR